MHIFSFTPDASLFPSAPFSAESSLSREEISLQGWSLERLSPTTIHVTLIEQVDARNPAAKTVTQQMHSAMAGLGETAIKSGGPPVIARLNGAKIAASRYDVDSTTLKFTYDAAAVRIVTPAALSRLGIGRGTTGIRVPNNIGRRDPFGDGMPDPMRPRSMVALHRSSSRSTPQLILGFKTTLADGE
jgi:hypothetical protein